ncbi:hypothetical protein Tco_1417299 [Tanacetum coccineum]
MISGIEKKEFLRNFYMEIPEQRFRSSYGSMPSKGARKRSFSKSLEIRSILDSGLKAPWRTKGDGHPMDLLEVACDSKNKDSGAPMGACHQKELGKDPSANP